MQQEGSELRVPDVHMVRKYVDVPAENENAKRVKVSDVAVAPSIQSTNRRKGTPRCRRRGVGQDRKKNGEREQRRVERRLAFSIAHTL